MAAERTSVKCLDCDSTVSPENKWQQCKCGHLYVDATTDPAKVGFLDEDRVEYTDEKGPKKKVQRSKDKFTESGTF